MSERVRVGLVFDSSMGYCRGVLRGIKRYAAAMPHWVLMPVVSEVNAIKALARWRPDGLVAYAYRESTVEAVAALGSPWVSVSGIMPDTGIPRVGADDVEVGRLAARHLLDCGIRRFAFIGHARHSASVRREAGFRETVERKGFVCDLYLEQGPRRFESRVHRWAPNRGFRRWLRSLPKPVGISTYYDLWGLHLSEACRESDLHLPEDVAVVGMGNDDLICELARPSLSSVAVPTGQIGFEAAALLDRLMSGAEPPAFPILLPPVGVVARQSSDVLAIADPDVALAVRLIRQHAHTPMNVADVLREVPVSRRSLERKFRLALDRGISEEIRRIRLEGAKNLLAGTDLPMPDLARRSGFSNARHLSVVFRQETALTPTAYRRQFRGDFAGR